MDKQAIAEVILSRVECSKGADNAIWCIGVTHDLEERAMQHGDKGPDIKHGMHGQADSLADARAIESHFLAKGMRGGTVGDLGPDRAVHVYIF